MRQRRLYLHIGAHKTGTTLLQVRVMRPENFPGLGEGDMTFVSIHHPEAGNYPEWRRRFTNVRNRLIAAAVAGAETAPLVEAMTQRVTDLLDALPGRAILWSDENVLGQTPGHLIAGRDVGAARLYPASAAIAAAFAALPPRYEVHVRLYRRETQSFAASCWRDWMAKLVAAEPREAFLARLDLASFDWDRVAAPWAAAFGPRFSEDAYERLRADPQGFVADFCRWAGLQPSPEAHRRAAEVVNAGLSDRQIGVALKVLPLIEPGEVQALRSFLNKLSRD